MEMITFYSPKTIHFGFHALHKVAAEAEKLGEKALIITDEVMCKEGHVEKCEQLLHEANIATHVYSGIYSEPTDVFVDEALTLFREQGVDFIISLGGGSCIDTAKAVSVLVTNDIPIDTLVEQHRTLDNPPIAIPTTSGTGSEVTDVTVITHTESQVKMMMKNHVFIPTVAIVDPQLTLSCPPSVVVGTGVDAFCHAVEAFISKRSHKMTDTFALSAMELIINHIEAVYQDNTNFEAKEAMSLAALHAGLAFSNASVCLIHGMSRPIGALFNVPHGMSNAMLLPIVLKYSQDACLGEMAVIGRIFNPEQVEHDTKQLAAFAIERVEALNRTLQVANLQDWGIDRKAFLQEIDRMAEDALASGSPANYPIVPTKEEIKNLYIECYDYK